MKYALMLIALLFAGVAHTQSAPTITVYGLGGQITMNGGLNVVEGQTLNSASISFVIADADGDDVGISATVNQPMQQVNWSSADFSSATIPAPYTHYVQNANGIWGVSGTVYQVDLTVTDNSASALQTNFTFYITVLPPGSGTSSGGGGGDGGGGCVATGHGAGLWWLALFGIPALVWLRRRAA